jgi:pyruvate carboxylase
MSSKFLVANRGEIAQGVSGRRTNGDRLGGGLPYEDRNSVHRQRSDDAYQICERGHPVRAYLDGAEIIRAAQAFGVSRPRSCCPR